MTDQQDRSRLDTVIDDVVRDMMQVEARSDLAGRVLRSLEQPPRRTWFMGAPALAAAGFAVVVLVAAVLPFRSADPVPVPSIQVVAGVPPEVTEVWAAPMAADLPHPTRPAQPPAPAATADSIFGPRRGQVAAASVRPGAQVQLALVLSDGARDGQPRTQALTLTASSGERRDGRAGGASGPQLEVSATPEVLASGDVRLAIAVLAPVQRQLNVTLVPGKPTPVLEAVDPRSGRRVRIDATVTILKPGTPQR